MTRARWRNAYAMTHGASSQTVIWFKISGASWAKRRGALQGLLATLLNYNCLPAPPRGPPRAWASSH